MAGKPQNRLELRRQYEAAEDLDPMEDEVEVAEDADDEVATKKPKRKPKAPAKAKAKTGKVAKPAARMRVVWTVVNDAFKVFATFEFAQKDAALAKAEELTAKGKGTYFVQRAKEAMADDAPGLGSLIPRTAAATGTTSAAAKKARKAEVEVEEEEIDDEEDEIEIEDDVDDED